MTNTLINMNEFFPYKTLYKKALIAHRGNLEGPNKEKENHPDYLNEALEKGFDVELDAWVVKNKVYLGHDEPLYEVSDYFGYQGKWYQYNGNITPGPAIWVHCKNFDALYASTFYFHGHYFTHDEDDFTLTSTGYVWTYPRNLPLANKSIAVMPERVQNWDLSKAHGICTDFPIKYKERFEIHDLFS